ncbi:hypothetical protein V492_01041, partial [Pseudogymnoascus sp. VKM F-4246]
MDQNTTNGDLELQISSTPQTAYRISEQDLHDIWTWNATVPEAVDACVHDLIAERTAQQPDAPAICAWDGDLTYHELDELSTRLAHQLVGLGVGPNVIVPLCFEKSMWTAVAMLAVMKAGGASVAMDSSQPEERLRSIVQQVEAELVLSSAANQAMSKTLMAGNVIIVCRENFDNVDNEKNILPLPPTAKPLDLLYVVFTSGSTGTPKGAMISHSNICSAIKHQQVSLGFMSTSRVFDFVSYAFDISWSNILHTFTCGGCLCIPSEHDRHEDIQGAMQRLRVNYAHLTPTVTRMLSAQDIACLVTLAFIGEPVTTSDVAQYHSSEAHMLNTYGPAECTPVSTLATIVSTGQSNLSIGNAYGANAWIVNPIDLDQLLPCGCVGELLLEGPIVGKGYFQDLEKTAQAFIEDPPWLLRGRAGNTGRRGRLYRTGDMVRYNYDGSLTFIGRKDAQA